MSMGKRTTSAREGVDREKLYSLTEAVKMVKERAKANIGEKNCDLCCPATSSCRPLSSISRNCRAL